MTRVFSILFAGLLLLPLLVTPALAKVGSSSARVHVVKAGDSLYEIARHNGMSVNELKRLNGLSGNRLSIGQKLALNRAAAPPLPVAAKTPKAQDSAPAAPAAATGQAVHVVKKGETLQAIAQAHAMSVKQLKAINGLKSSKLKIGQRLTLTGEDRAAQVAAPAQPRQQSSRSGRDVHVVKKGDTLSAISRRHHIPVRELKRLNGLRGNNLRIGQRLALNDPSEERNPILLPGDSNEEEILAMAYSAESELEQAAFNFLSTPYRFGGSSRRGIDCSSFVQQVFREVNVSLPRSAREQFRVGTEIDRAELQPGDLVFFRTYARFPSHVGIYLGDNKMIHASSRSRRVVVTSLDLPYYRKRFIGAKRISLLDDMEEPGDEQGSLPAQDLTVAKTDMVGAAESDESEDEELGDTIEDEEVYLVPPADLLKPSIKPETAAVGSSATPARQTASTTPVAAAPVN